MGILEQLFSTGAGVFFYQFITMTILLGAIIVAATGTPQYAWNISKRILTGLSVLLGLRLALSIGAFLATQGRINPNQFVILERGITGASWIGLIWVWSFPEKNKSADSAGLLLVSLSLISLFFSMALFSDPAAESAFDLQWVLKIWNIISIGTLALGLIILSQRKPLQWGYGFTMLGILLISEFTVLFGNENTSAFPLALRLAQITAFPILFAIFHRITQPKDSPKQSEAPTFIRPVPERKRINLPYEILESLLTIGRSPNIENNCQEIAKAMSYALIADICLLISRPTELDEIKIYCGYDQISEKDIQGVKFSARHLPMLSSAMKKDAALRLPASSSSADLKFLKGKLELPKSGHLLAVPLNSRKYPDLGALVLLTPYSLRTWSAEDQIYLINAGSNILQLLDRSALTTQSGLAGKTDSATEESINTGPKPEISKTKNRIDSQAATFHSEKNKLIDSSEVVNLESQNEKSIERILAEKFMSSETKIVKDMLRYTTSGDEFVELNLSQASFTDIVESAIEAISPVLRDKRVSLLVDLKKNLPDIQADVQGLRLALQMLLHNVVSTSRINSEISIRAETDMQSPEKGYIVLHISSNNQWNGKQLTAQTTTDENEQKGAPGVDFIAAKSIIEAHMGSIESDEIKSKGINYSVSFPLKQQTNNQ